MPKRKPKYVIISGGIGGAKLVQGFYNYISPDDLAVICNTGDDIKRFGLYISPDVDIVMYTLAEIIHKKQLWGIQDDTFNVLKALRRFYGEDSNWFNLGDVDLATHIFRSDMLARGIPLSNVVNKIRIKLRIKSEILPMSEDYIPTHVETEIGRIHFEEYLVKYLSRLNVKKMIYGGGSDSVVPDRAKELLNSADKIIIAPSNPFMSIGPLLAIPYYREVLKKNKKKIIAVSPIINGNAVKGPIIQNMKDMGYRPDSLGIATFYQEMMDRFVFDKRDLNDEGNSILEKLDDMGITGYYFDTLMVNLDKKKELAKFICQI